MAATVVVGTTAGAKGTGMGPYEVLVLLLTTTAVEPRGRRELAAWVVQERSADGQCTWTAPRGAGPGAPGSGTDAQAAAEAVHRTLHVDLPANALGDPQRFTRVAVRPTPGGSKPSRTVAFVARGPEAAADGAVPPDAASSASSPAPVLVRTTRVAVHALLALDTVGYRSTLDVDGQPVTPLSDAFGDVLCHRDVRAALAKALAMYGGPVAPYTEAGLAPPERPPQPPQHYARDSRYHVVATRGQFRLLVGNLRAAMDAEVIADEGVTHVVHCAVADVADRPHQWAPFAPRVQYRFVYTDDMAPDLASQDPADQWGPVMAFLRECEASGGTALVHCWAGINRSVTTAAVYMALEGYAPDVRSAVVEIRKKRPQAGPFPMYVAFGTAFVASVARGGDGAVAAAGPTAGPPLPTVSVPALYERACKLDWEALNTTLAAQPGALAEARAFRASASGEGFLHRAAAQGNAAQCRRLCEEFDFDPDIADHLGLSPADAAGADGYPQLAAYLHMRAGTDV